MEEDKFLGRNCFVQIIDNKTFVSIKNKSSVIIYPYCFRTNFQSEDKRYLCHQREAEGLFYLGIFIEDKY